MARSGPKPLVDEREFVPRDLDQARELHQALIDAGTPLHQAAGIVMWLSTLPERRSEDPRTNTVRRDYRQRLAVLGCPPWRSTRVAIRLLEPTGSTPPYHSGRRLDRLNRRRNRGGPTKAEAA